MPNSWLTSASLPTATIRPASIATASARGRSGDMVRIGPPTKARLTPALPPAEALARGEMLAEDDGEGEVVQAATSAARPVKVPESRRNSRRESGRGVHSMRRPPQALWSLASTSPRPRIIGVVNPLYVLIEATASIFFIGAALAALRRGRLPFLELVSAAAFGILLEEGDQLVFETYHYSTDWILAIDRAPVVIGLTWALIIAGAMRLTDA